MAAETTLRYVRTDYSSHRESLLQRVRSRWSLIWNDFLSNDVGQMFVDLIAWSTSTMAFLINRLAGEVFITTATTRESMVRIGALTGYKLHGPIPATLLCEATLSSPASGDEATAFLKIPKGTVVRAGDQGLAFEVKRDYYIYGGQTTPVTTVVTLDARLTGSRVISTNVKTTNGSPYIDLIDTSVDLTLYAELGQSVWKARPSTDSKIYVIQSIEQAPDSISSTGTRLVVNPVWSSNLSDEEELIPIDIVERRIELRQGQTLSERFITPPVETSGYVVKLSRTPIIDGSIKLTVNGVLWTEASSLAIETSTDEIYEIATLATGETLLKFGDGIFGAVVPTDAVLLVEYRVGGGNQGNIPLNSINTSLTGFTVSLSNPVTVTVKNSTATGKGGRDAETIEEARVNIPFSTKANDRAVHLDDWQSLSTSFSHPQHGSVAYARATVRTENSLLEGNIVVVYAWTTGPNNSLVSLSSPLKSALKDHLLSKSVGTDYVIVADGTERPVPISLRFKVFDGYDVSDTTKLVQNRILSVIQDLRPGSPIIHSNLLRSLDEVTGVDTVALATPVSDLVASNPSELFVNPSEDFVYKISRNFKQNVTATISGVNTTVNTYTAQLPVSPLAAWSLRMFLGGNELTVIPDITPGFARLLGDGVVIDDDETRYRSTINLLTGQVEIVLLGSPGDLTMKLIPVTGYNADRIVNVYVGYSGTNTAEKRAEIRSALRSWAEGFKVGSPIFADRITGLNVSRSNIKSVVKAISGVISVNRVALDTPANTDDRLNAAEFELLRLGAVTVNNRID